MFNLDPALAYTKEINEAILGRVWEENYAGAVADGLATDEATAHADAQRKAGRNTVNKALLARSTKLDAE